jgi:hypothetical protein
MKEDLEKTIDEYEIIEYRLNGQLHRKKGPAVEYKNGDKFWYKNGLLHRTDGPAVEFANGDKSWWLEGIRYTEEEYNNKIEE